MNRYYFIVNPISGSGRSEEWFRETRALLDEKGVDYAFRFTEYAGHACSLTQEALEAGEKCIVAVGGDGTCREVASVLRGTDVTMGVLPFGTGNDFAAALGLESDVPAALGALLNGTATPTDIGLANGEAFVNVAGFGFDVDVVRYTEKYKKRFNGMLPYMLGILQSILHLSPIEVTITANGQAFTEKLHLCSVCNGFRFAGGIRVAPEADIHDGLFDVCMVRGINVLAFLLLLPKYVKGDHLSSKAIGYFKTDSLAIATDHKSVLQLDGELLSSTPVTYAVEKHALNMLVPSPGK